LFITSSLSLVITVGTGTGFSATGGTKGATAGGGALGTIGFVGDGSAATTQDVTQRYDKIAGKSFRGFEKDFISVFVR
jgi:hypothetical protein